MTQFTPHHVIDSISSSHRAHNFSVPVDHFPSVPVYEPHSEDNFSLRYWFDAKHYSEGGPVIILASGETRGEDRLPFLEHGILSMLAEATGGLAVILEHRYYGRSFPVPDLSAENMRFLSTEQALADTAYFAQHVQFPGLEHVNLTAPNVPYIIYGGSYAGAFAAFARKLYPDLFWGAIASSAVTEAIVDYWEYYEAARLFSPGDCAVTTQKLTHVVDNILLGRDETSKQLLKQAFGLEELRDDDFANVLSRGISGLQASNWDPEEDDSDFAFYCSSISSADILFASSRSLAPVAKQLLRAGGYETEVDVLTNRMLNYIGYIRAHLREDLRTYCKNKNVNECYSSRGTHNRTTLDQGMGRSWGYQTCTQWGYFQTGSGVPSDQLPLISRLIDLNFTTIHCREAFNITKPPDVESINKLGGLNFRYPRVAFIDGAADPWRAATPHRIGLPQRVSTTSEPFILIDHGVHHWDENNLRPKSISIGLPPPSVAAAQSQIISFVQAWLEVWKEQTANGPEEDVPSEL
ncbi:peptidase S28 [Mariannaea sp. PMI_226]|nr:peptidase S28 [Mariannaea sp. PMI_226]